MKSFASIYDRAARRKGGEAVLQQLLPRVRSAAALRRRPDSFFLAWMTRCVFNAGFHWGVISQKWPDFTEVFYEFDVPTILRLPDAFWEQAAKDTRIVRNPQKIRTIYDNALFIHDIAQQHGSFARWFADWPADDLVGMWDVMKKRGVRLGGNTRQYVTRFAGKDCFLLSRDVVTGLQDAGVDIAESPTSQRDLRAVQDAFNAWHAETGMPLTHLSLVLGYSTGANYPPDEILTHMSHRRDV